MPNSVIKELSILLQTKSCYSEIQIDYPFDKALFLKYSSPNIYLCSEFW